MSFKRRVFISYANPDLLDDRRKALQEAIIEQIKQRDLKPEMILLKGDAAFKSWSLHNVTEVMRKCVGAVIIAFPRWQTTEQSGSNLQLASEFAQIEGAVASALKLPLLVIAEKGIAERGVTWTGAGYPIAYIPPDATAASLVTGTFPQRFGVWADEVAERSDVFLGYSSKAESTAQAIDLFLTKRMGLKVRDWKIYFTASGIIIDEIEKASELCSGGIFLFTKDDVMQGDEQKAAPRDNVVFEAGYFAAARGRDRVLIIREEGAKMPADLGGNIYLTITDRNDIRPIETAIREFVERRL